MTLGSSLLPESRTDSRHVPPSGVNEARDLTQMLRALGLPLFAQRWGDKICLFENPPQDSALLGMVPSVRLESLGARSFRETHGTRYAYVSGAMAGGIASAELVVAMGRAGFLGFFGAGGISLERIEQALGEVQRSIGDAPYGFNLLHNHFEPHVEMQTAEMYLRYRVRRIEAAAFLEMTAPVVYFRASGMRRLPDGTVAAPNHVFAKVSRPEVAAHFMAPPHEIGPGYLASGG